VDYPREKMFPIDFEVQRSIAQDIEVEIQFLGYRTLPLTPRVTISHIYTVHGKKMFLIDFEVKRSKFKFTGH
jgi:hypothetical protein